MTNEKNWVREALESFQRVGGPLSEVLVVYKGKNDEISEVTYYVKELIESAAYYNFDYDQVSCVHAAGGTESHPHKLYYDLEV